MYYLCTTTSVYIVCVVQKGPVSAQQEGCRNNNADPLQQWNALRQAAAQHPDNFRHKTIISKLYIHIYVHHPPCSVLCSSKLSHWFLKISYASEHGRPITLDPPLLGSSTTSPNRTSVSIALSIGISIYKYLSTSSSIQNIMEKQRTNYCLFTFALNFSYMNRSHVSLMLARDDTCSIQ